MAAKKGRDRTARRASDRASDRANEKTIEAKRMLWTLTEGGSADRPWVVASASVIESISRALPCLACDATVDVAAHDALTVGDQRLRKVDTRCRQCGDVREIFFKIVSALPN